MELEKRLKCNYRGNMESSNKGKHLEKTKRILEQRKRPFYKKRRVIIPAITTLVCGICLILLLFYSIFYKSTDNAFIEGHIVTIAPKVAGHVVKLNVVDNQYIEKGYLIAEIDPRDYQVDLEQAENRLDEAKAKLIVNQKSVDEKMCNLDFAKKDYKRNSDMISAGAISQIEYEKSLNILNNAQAQYDSSQNAKISTEAEIRRLEAQVKQAKLNLEYTKIIAPQSGKVTARSVELGNYIAVGQPLLGISTDDMWVIANFKENQITNMKEGQPVLIKLDTYPNKKFKGHVDSIQRATGAKASLFPPENAVGSYVKIVQRIPVKIVFDEDYSKYNIAPGMSVVPSVKVK